MRRKHTKVTRKKQYNIECDNIAFWGEMSARGFGIDKLFDTDTLEDSSLRVQPLDKHLFKIYGHKGDHIFTVVFHRLFLSTVYKIQAVTNTRLFEGGHIKRNTLIEYKQLDLIQKGGEN